MKEIDWILVPATNVTPISYPKKKNNVDAQTSALGLQKLLLHFCIQFISWILSGNQLSIFDHENSLTLIVIYSTNTLSLHMP